MAPRSVRSWTPTCGTGCRGEAGLPLPFRGREVAVREWPRPSPRAMGRRQDAGATLQPVRHSRLLGRSRQGCSRTAPLRFQPVTAPGFGILFDSLVVSRQGGLRTRPYPDPPFPIPHSPFPIPHLPFTIRYSPFAAFRCSPGAVGVPESRVASEETRVTNRRGRTGVCPRIGGVGLFENRRNSSERRANGAGLLVAKPRP
jgi:hypothetical protein